MKKKNTEVQSKANYNIECGATISLKDLKDIGVAKNTKEFNSRIKALKAYAKELGLSLWTDEPIDTPKIVAVEADDDYTRR
jgi:aspartate aminotransferase-like enzyme